MNCINFREIEKGIARRTQEIFNLRQELPKYLTLDEKLRVIVDSDHQQQALNLVKQINQLKKQNATDTKLMQKAREVSLKYNLPIDRSGMINENPEILDLDKLEGNARNSIPSLEYQLKHGFLHNSLTVDSQNRLNAEIEKHQKTLESVLLAKKELAEVTT